MKIIERRGVQESIQVLQAHTWKKHDGSGKSKGKFDKSNNKKGHGQTHRNTRMMRNLNPLREEEGT